MTVDRSDPAPRILVITYGELSGVRQNLIDALRRRGCRITEVQHTLRYLRFRFLYAALIFVAAVSVHGARYRRYLDRTWAAQWARGRANQAAVKREHDVDAVIGLAMVPTHTNRRADLTYAILTDHTNLLSKRSPNFGVHIPEASVRPSWNTHERRVLNAQDRVFAMSHYVEGSIAQDYDVAPDKIVVVGAGPNLNVDFKRDGVAKDHRARNILFVGLDPIRKGLPTLLAAFERVARTFPDARLDVVGVHGPDGDNVHYRGPLRGEPLKQLFYAAQIFAMPSIREPFGIVFLEAMWSGAVCIGANHSAMPEIIDDGVTGFVVEPQNTAALADRITQLFENPDRLREMAEAAYRAATERWSWDLAAGAIVDSLFTGHARSTVTGEGA